MGYHLRGVFDLFFGSSRYKPKYESSYLRKLAFWDKKRWVLSGFVADQWLYKKASESTSAPTFVVRHEAPDPLADHWLQVAPMEIYTHDRRKTFDLTIDCSMILLNDTFGPHSADGKTLKAKLQEVFENTTDDWRCEKSEFASEWLSQNDKGKASTSDYDQLLADACAEEYMRRARANLADTSFTVEGMIC